MASSKFLSSTEKENRSCGNERDHFVHFCSHSTGRFSLFSSAMIATTLATHAHIHRFLPCGFNFCMRLHTIAPTQYPYKLLTTRVGGMYWILIWLNQRALLQVYYMSMYMYLCVLPCCIVQWTCDALVCMHAKLKGIRSLVCVSVTPISGRTVKTKCWQVQYRHNNYLELDSLRFLS